MDFNFLHLYFLKKNMSQFLSIPTVVFFFFCIYIYILTLQMSLAYYFIYPSELGSSEVCKGKHI